MLNLDKMVVKTGHLRRARHDVQQPGPLEADEVMAQPVLLRWICSRDSS